MPQIVSLDIETTGLDPQREAIIEIGAVLFNDRRIEDKWTTLINPGRAIPPFITNLTGISNQMVANAPPLQAVLRDLIDFVGNTPILGQNISFDLSFFRRHGAFTDNKRLDTYEMAAILMPNAGRYNLGALAQALTVPLPATHRALDDAMVTHGVYLRLHQMALDLPIDLLAEIVRWGEQIEWDGYWAFRRALRLRSRETVRGKIVSQDYAGPLFDRRADRPVAPIQVKDDLLPIDPDEVAAVLEHGGVFSRQFPNFEYRPQQVDMLRAVTEALSEGRHLLVEASTGVGKSFAYVIPAAVWAVKNNTRVVISTNTINLQDQLINKDIPSVRQALDLPLQAAVLKGRSNYLCPRRLEAMRRKGPENGEELRVVAKVMVWLRQTSSGDRSEINLNGPVEREIWSRFSAEDEGCTSDTCVQRTGGACPFYQARQAAQNAHLLIVNHALLLADVATGNRVLPEFDYLIVDEAHHLEEATTNALGFRVNQYEIDRLLRTLGGPKSGVLGWILVALEDVLTPTDYAAINRLVEHATDQAFSFENLARQFFQTIEQFLFDLREGKPVGPYGHQERILPSTRKLPAWEEVEISWDEGERRLRSLLEALEQIGQGLSELLEALPEEGQDLYTQLTSNYRRLKELQENLNALVFEPEALRIYWAELQSDGRRLSLHAVPLHIGPLMERYIWHEKAAVILTSATLTTAGEFDYLRGRLYAEDAYELALGSPFDYESAALLYLADNIPEPGDMRNYQRAVEYGLINLCRATDGRTLVLFTSYAQLRRTAHAISPALAENDIIVYEQGEGASPHTLLETFRSSDKAVLLGTRAFWEGVDIPGDPLSVLVIVKLPFDVPTDPVIASRSETFEDPFSQYALPEAILRFRQGFGRLIRTQFDRGVVAVFDKRLLTKSYGRAFTESLPPCTIKVGPMEQLPHTAAQWLNL